MVVLRDGRKLLGILRSWDQFGMQFYLSNAHKGHGNHVNPNY